MNLRRVAWRNMMVAAINEGLARGLFTLTPGDRWSTQPLHVDVLGEKYRFKFNENVDAIAYVKHDGWDELVFHVALWPTPDCEQWVHCSNADFLAGEAWASGWLERRRGPWLQVSKGDPLFCCRRDRLEIVASAVIQAKGYKDNGPFQM